MLSARTSKLRDWGLFLLVALLPATAIGLLGLRALYNEEAAIKREMRVVLDQAADAAQRQYEAALEDLEAERIETADFADRLSMAAPQTEPANARDKRKTEPQEDCPELARKLRRGVQPDQARRSILAECEAARSSTGRWLWLAVALSKHAAVSRPRLEEWLSQHGSELTVAERAATRLDIDAATWLDDGDRAALLAHLDGGGERAAAPPLQSAQRYAMRMGRPRIEWSERGARGLLVRKGDGTYQGFIVHPGSLARALHRGWPELPNDVTARLVIGAQAQGPAAFEALRDGAHIELHYRNPGAVEARTQRSKRILLSVAMFACLIAIALVALLFSRMRSERRVSALRTDFVAAVSHELRTPIASIRMLSELLADGSIDDEEEKKEMHEALAREAKRLGETVNRLLGFSRMEAGKQTATRDTTQVATPVEEAISTVEERHPGCEIARDLDEGISAPIDSDGVRMAVTNLLTNALKYAQPPYSVGLAAERDGVRIEVRDSGPGLSKRDQKRIFRPFERADDRLSQATEGSGIGLSLVNHVAHSHRGRAGVESELGAGSTFFLWLPMTEDAQPRAEDAR